MSIEFDVTIFLVFHDASEYNVKSNVIKAEFRCHFLPKLKTVELRGDSNNYKQYTIFNTEQKITLNYPKSAAMGFFPRNSRTSSKQLWYTSHQCSSH